MKALYLTAPRKLSLSDTNPPQEAADRTMLKIEAVGIGGSEYLAFANPGMRTLPNAMGHGFAGITEDGVRAAVFPLVGCGDCEWCTNNETQLCESWSLIGVHTDGGFQQSVSVPSEAIVAIPNALSWEQTAFIEPFANSVNAWKQAEVKSSDTVAILGLGGLGLGLVAVAKAEGFDDIHAADLSVERQRAAQGLGAKETGETLSGKFDVVFDTVGSVEARTIALSLARKGGRCILMGFASSKFSFNATEFIRSQKAMVGAFVYSKEQFCRAVTLAEQCDSGWVANLKFTEVEPQLQRFLDDDFSIVKAALRPNE